MERKKQSSPLVREPHCRWGSQTIENGRNVDGLYEERKNDLLRWSGNPTAVAAAVAHFLVLLFCCSLSPSLCRRLAHLEGTQLLKERPVTNFFSSKALVLEKITIFCPGMNADNADLMSMFQIYRRHQGN